MDRETGGMKKEIKFNFNHDLYREVRKVRERMGMEVANLNLDTFHSDIGKRVLDTENGKIYNVEDIRQHWYNGWYYTAILECNRSHAVVWWGDVNCQDDVILKGIEENRKKYQFVEE